MAFTFQDERELLPALFEGIFEQPVWDGFLQKLLIRTQAGRVGLMLRHGANPLAPPLLRVVATRPALPKIDLACFTDAGLLPFAALRPSRVYALGELLDHDDPVRRKAQEATLSLAAIAHGRVIRIVARNDHNAWLLLLSDREDFTASDAALLSALSPLVASALAAIGAVDELRLRSAMAEDALALLGIGQAGFARDGRIVAADALAARQFARRAASASAPSAHALSEACLGLEGAPAGVRKLIAGDDGRTERALLLRPASPTDLAMPSPVVATGALRQARRENAASGALILAQMLGLSAREAALAEAISRGKSIVDAGAELKLTPETARNYSKRIYAKTGTVGQADLVRLLLTGLVPLA